MPNSTILDISQAEQDQMLSQLRQARYGYLLALHVLLLCAAGRTPTEISAFTFGIGTLLLISPPAIFLAIYRDLNRTI